MGCGIEGTFIINNNFWPDRLCFTQKWITLFWRQPLFLIRGGVDMDKGLRGFVTWLFGGHKDEIMQVDPAPVDFSKVKFDLLS